MSKTAFISSAIMHGTVLALMAMEISFARFDKVYSKPALLMIDLSKIQITDKTNLPPKLAFKKEVKKVQAKENKIKETAKTKSIQVQKKSKEPLKPIPKEPDKKAVSVMENKLKSPPKKTKEQTKPQKEPSAEEQLKSLLASVDKIKKAVPVPREEKLLKEQTLTDGIEEGTVGSLSSFLTISERDLISSQIAKNWLIDAGKKGIQNMIIEIQVRVNRDGSIKDVEIMNLPSDPVKRSVAESAWRAILVCDNQKDCSPFRILAEKYADYYDRWKTVKLNFNPMTGGVM